MLFELSKIIDQSFLCLHHSLWLHFTQFLKSLQYLNKFQGNNLIFVEEKEKNVDNI